MRRSQVEHVAAGLRHIDIVMTQQVQLVEDPLRRAKEDQYLLVFLFIFALARAALGNVLGNIVQGSPLQFQRLPH